MKAAIRFFSGFGLRHFSSQLGSLKGLLVKSNLSILYEIYVGKMFLYSSILFLASALSSLSALLILGVPLLPAAAFGLASGAGVFVLSVLSFYFYPFHVISNKQKSIDSNLPFAINHMSAIAASGVPPAVMFRIISNIPEYREISSESKRIVRNMEKFGMDIVSSVRSVLQRTPSSEFRQFLSGFIATIETGGDLKKFLENNAKEAMFNYRIRREKYIKSLSMYADFYTAVLIAAPLFFISILSIMSMLGGSVFGFSIPTIMRIGVYGMMPILNIMFIAFLHYTQPNI